MNFRKHLVLTSILFLSFTLLNQSESFYVYCELSSGNINNYKITSSATIYQTVPIEVNSTYVRNLATELLGFGGTLSESDESFIISEGNKTFEVDKRSGSIWYSDFSQMWNISYTPDLPDLATCNTTAFNFIEGTSIYVEPSEFTFGSTNATAYNTETRDTIEKILDFKVIFGFELDGIPLGGPGGTSSVTIGHGGEVIGFDWIYRPVVSYASEPIIDIQDVISSHGITEYVSEEHNLVYFQDSVGTNQEFIYPVYEVEFTNIKNGEKYAFERYLPATTFCPKVTITKPSDDKSFMPDDNVEFDCNVADGTGPFNYYWESNFDGYLNNTKSFSFADLTIAARGNSTLKHTIQVTVTDANGITASDEVLVSIVRNTSTFGFEMLFIIGLLGLGLITSSSIQKKKKSISVVVFVGLMFFISSIYQVAQVQATSNSQNQNNYSIETGDDFPIEVAIEWNVYSGSDYIPNSDDLAKRFYNKMASFTGWLGSFSFGQLSAWEEDFKFETAQNGGTDNYYIDAVDLALFSGHGWYTGVSFMGNHDDTWLDHTECRWGDGDLEWMLLDACRTLGLTSDLGVSVFDR